MKPTQQSFQMNFILTQNTEKWQFHSLGLQQKKFKQLKQVVSGI